MKLYNKSLSQQIYETLRDDIIKGERRPGDRIVELDVAREFGVSQAPVREALLKLAEEGLVVSHRYKGTFVSNISIDEIDELYSFRIMMEEMAIRRAMARTSPADVESLENFYQEMVKSGQENDLDSLRTADVNFHTQIYKMANHSFMYQVWETLSSKLNRIWYLTSQMYFTELGEVANIHFPILQAFKDRDVQACIQAFHDHVNYEKKQRLLFMESENDRDSTNETQSNI
ncbi:GntR family transcriptional regulator [Ammoniphilus sp. YIM 78166]|uniref:GntR family transcriptional regulator n=1 Tax=Ammoniphilus sp. YIM 78166 TaxID=1644106 RepID=UPI0010701999|nr:GntR family transcriptional regulator [Ammoniphilus sp. YIM 78166]